MSQHVQTRKSAAQRLCASSQVQYYWCKGESWTEQGRERTRSHKYLEKRKWDGFDHILTLFPHYFLLSQLRCVFPESRRWNAELVMSPHPTPKQTIYRNPRTPSQPLRKEEERRANRIRVGGVILPWRGRPRRRRSVESERGGEEKPLQGKKKKKKRSQRESQDAKWKWHCLLDGILSFLSFMQRARRWGDAAKMHPKYTWQRRRRQSSGFTVPYNISVIFNSCHHESQGPTPLWGQLRRENYANKDQIRAPGALHECQGHHLNGHLFFFTSNSTHRNQGAILLLYIV